MELHTSETITDTSNTNTNNELSLSFEINNGGTETSYVEDKLLTNYEVAKARAESIFLDEGYINKRISFSTYHIDNLHIGDVVQVDSLLYKVITINEKIQGAKVSMDITAERFAKTEMILDVKEVFFTIIGDVNKIISHSDGYIYATSYSNGNIYRSFDGEVWVQVLSTSAIYMPAIISHSDGYIYAVAYGDPTSYIYRSLNGTAWNIVYTGTDDLEVLCSHSDGYIYCGAYSYMTRSLDGITWTDISVSFTSINQIVSHGGSLFLSAFYLGVRRLFKSDNGTTWADIGIIKNNMKSINGYIYGTSTSGLYKTTDGASWNITYDYILSNIEDYTLHNTDIYIASMDGAVSKSSDYGQTYEEIFKTAANPLFLIASHDSYVIAFEQTTNAYKLEYKLVKE